MGSKMQSSTGYDEDTTKCAESFSAIMNVAGTTSYKNNGPDPLQIMFISSGKSINDLGNYKYCQMSQNLTKSVVNLSYSLVTITSASNSYD